MTVAEYFKLKYQEDIDSGNTEGLFAKAMGGQGGQLRYPTLPTVNVGSKKKPV